MRCASCGADNPEGAALCQDCGAVLSPSPFVTPTSAVKPLGPVISDAVAERLETIDHIATQASPDSPPDSSHTMLFDDLVGSEDDEIEATSDVDEGAVCNKASETSDTVAPEVQEKEEVSTTSKPESEESLLSCQIVLKEQNGAAYEILLTSKHLIEVIGRDIRSVDLPIEDERISRIHCQLIFSPVDSTVSVEDLGSTNGTRVNGQRIEGAQQLQERDVLRIGHTELVVSLPKQQD